MRIATSRYQAHGLIRTSGLAPVRITLGRPRFRLPYQIAGDVRELAPSAQMFKLDDEQFWPAYEACLETLDATEVVGRLAQIAREASTDGVVLLCFENVLGGERCHRQSVAAWLARETGIEVDELGASPIRRRARC